MTYRSSEVFAVRRQLHDFLWNKVEVDDGTLWDIVDSLLAEDYISDVPFQEIKEEK